MTTKRDILKALIKLTVEEIIFLEKGYGGDLPQPLVREYETLQECNRWLHNEVNALNEREFPNDFGT